MVTPEAPAASSHLVGEQDVPERDNTEPEPQAEDLLDEKPSPRSSSSSAQASSTGNRLVISRHGLSLESGKLGRGRRIAAAGSPRSPALELATPFGSDYFRANLERISSLDERRSYVQSQEPITPRLISPGSSASNSRRSTPSGSRRTSPSRSRRSTPSGSRRSTPSSSPRRKERHEASLRAAPRHPCVVSAELVPVAYSTLQACCKRRRPLTRQCSSQSVDSVFSYSNEDEDLEIMVSEMQGKFSELQTCHPSQLEQDERLAFWLNVLNAAIMCALCLADSIPGQPGQVLPMRSWVSFLQNNHVDVGGHQLSLFEVEHLMLRACSQPPTGSLASFFIQALSEAKREKADTHIQRFGEGFFRMALESAAPEVSFGISYPIRAGCPPLRVYRPEVVKPQLLLNCAHYIRRCTQTYGSKSRVALPAFFKYYRNDFVDSPCDLLNLAREFFGTVPAALQNVQEVSGCRLSQADLRLAAESVELERELAAQLQPTREDLFFGDDSTSASSTTRHVTPGAQFHSADFDWTFEFDSQPTVCPELEHLGGSPVVHNESEVLACEVFIEKNAEIADEKLAHEETREMTGTLNANEDSSEGCPRRPTETAAAFRRPMDNQRSFVHSALGSRHVLCGPSVAKNMGDDSDHSHPVMQEESDGERIERSSSSGHSKLKLNNLVDAMLDQAWPSMMDEMQTWDFERLRSDCMAPVTKTMSTQGMSKHFLRPLEASRESTSYEIKCASCQRFVDHIARDERALPGSDHVSKPFQQECTSYQIEFKALQGVQCVSCSREDTNYELKFPNAEPTL